MLKLEIRLNEDLIKQEAKYTAISIYQALDKIFLKHDFHKTNLPDGTVCYSGTGKKQDYGVFGYLITTLKDKQWFMAYLEKWLWYNSDDGVNEDDYIVEDVLYFYTKKESAA
ncbi:MAG: hypothetical protein IJV92_02000 [Phascolarctobacterium sp.]|nr:hypothetical protein [Phascolarctobacterium sp.]